MVRLMRIYQHLDQSFMCRYSIIQPLNPNPESTWNRFFVDNQVLLQIDHDTRYYVMESTTSI